MIRLSEVREVWQFVRYIMVEEQTASFAKGFNSRFAGLCVELRIPVPTKNSDWGSLRLNEEVPAEAEQNFEQFRNWLKRQSPEFARRFGL